MSNTTKVYLVLFVLVMLLAFMLIWGAANHPYTAEGSSVVGNDYYATTTGATSGNPAIRTLKTGDGALGSVVITGANSGTITVYNATTSNVTLRASGKASSTIIIADFPANAATGTYTFDAQITDGLLVVTSGNAPTSTVTYR